MNGIEIEYVPSLKNHMEAYETYESSTTIRKVEKIIAITLIIFGAMFVAYSFYINLFFKLRMILILIMFFIILDVLDLLDIAKLIYKIRFKQNPKFKNKQKIKFTEEKIFYETNKIKSELEWTFYKKFLESKNTLILIFGKRQYSVIPKSAFREEEVIILKNFIQNKLNNKNL